MSLAFPTREWVSAYGTEINASQSYREASKEWTHGAVALTALAAKIGDNMRWPVHIAGYQERVDLPA